MFPRRTEVLEPRWRPIHNGLRRQAPTKLDSLTNSVGCAGPKPYGALSIPNNPLAARLARRARADTTADGARIGRRDGLTQWFRKMRAMQQVLNIAAYKFVALSDREALRERLLERCASLGLKGTILLAEEGINLFLAGAAAAVETFLHDLRTDLRFADLYAKRSWSDSVPFQRLRVRLKREIIRMDHPTIRPALGRALSVNAATLARWLDAGCDDAGQPVVMLDTRNAFEVDHGSFVGAIDWRINKFTEFPHAVQAHQQQLAGKTVVSFCTGGIRCEKAAIYMQEAGLSHVYQLEGGILQYFEDVGSRHYRGTCFVFDEREALDATLAPA